MTMANSAAQLPSTINHLSLGAVSDKTKSLWTEAWESLPKEDQVHFDQSRQDLLTVLGDVSSILRPVDVQLKQTGFLHAPNEAS